MTRLQIELEILQILSLVDTDGSTIHADTATRNYIQSKIQQAVDQIVLENRFSWTRKPFGGLLKAPLTGTLNFTQGLFTAVVSGQTPDQSWVGCSVYFAANVSPLRITSLSGQTLTFAQPIYAPTAAAQAFTLYFDAVLVPADCRGLNENTLVIAGARKLQYVTTQEMDNRQGYYAWNGTDYGFWSYGSGSISTPDIGQPTLYTFWENFRDSNNISRLLLRVYPFPNGILTLSFNGWIAPTQMTADADIPCVPTFYHRTTLLPLVKLLMCDYPGWELSAQEKATAQSSYQTGLNQMYNESHQDTSETRPVKASSYCQ